MSWVWQCEREWAEADKPLDAVVGGQTEQPSLLCSPLLLQPRGAAQACTHPPLLQPGRISPPSADTQRADDGEEHGAQASPLLGGAGGISDQNYVGITRKAHCQLSPFSATINWQKQTYHLGSFPDAVSAAKAYDWALRLVGEKRKLNFGRTIDLGTPPASNGAASLRARVSQLGGAGALQRAAAEARYLGVATSNNSSINPFRAHVHWRGKVYYLGCFSEALPAAKAYDWAARLTGGGRPLNFDPSDDLGAQPTAPGAAQLRSDVAAAAAQAARSLGPGAPLPGGSRSRTTLASAALPAQQQQQRPPSTAGVSSKRPACIASPPGPPPAAKKRAPPKQQPAPGGTTAPSLSARGVLASRLRLLLRLRRLREDGFALDELGEGALRDITADVRRAEPAGVGLQQAAAASLAGYSALDLQARLAVNMRLRALSEDGVRLDLLTGEVGRGLLLDLLVAR